MASAHDLAHRTRLLAIALAIALLVFSGAPLVVRALVAIAISLAATGIVLRATRVVEAVHIAEASLVGASVGLAQGTDPTVLAFLVFPALLTSVTVSQRWALIAIGAEFITLAGGVAVWGSAPDAEQARAILAWTVVSLGAVPLGILLRERFATDARADRADRLLRTLVEQLHAAAERTTGSLDVGSVASELNGVLRATVSPDAFVEPHKAGHRVDGSLAPDGDRLLLELGGRTVATAHVPDAAAKATDIQEAAAPLLPRLQAAILLEEVSSDATRGERRRLAAEIHDGMSQDLVSCTYLLDDILTDVHTTAPGALEPRLNELLERLRRCVRDVRRAVVDLRALDDTSVGLAAAVSRSATLAVRSSPIELLLDLRADSSEGHHLPDQVADAARSELLRISQEALSNAIRHSSASRIWVECDQSHSRTRIAVHDDGQGLGDRSIDSQGMLIMRERADRIGADLTIHSPGREGGTSVIAELSVSSLRAGSTAVTTGGTL